MAHDVVLTEPCFLTIEQFETEDAERIINKLKGIGNFPDHFLDRIKNDQGYKFRVGDFRTLLDWDKGNKIIYAIDIFGQMKEYRQLGKFREKWDPDATTNRRGRLRINA